MDQRALLVEIDAATQLGLLGFLRGRGYQCLAVVYLGSSPGTRRTLASSCTRGRPQQCRDRRARLIQCLKLRQPNSGPIIAITDRDSARRAPFRRRWRPCCINRSGLAELQQVIDQPIAPPARRTQALEQSDGANSTRGRIVAQSQDDGGSPDLSARPPRRCHRSGHRRDGHRARNWSHGRSITFPRAAAGHSSRSTAPPCRASCWRASCFGYERRRLHGRPQAQDRQVRSGAPGHHLPRRDRRPPSHASGQAAPRPPGRRVLTHRRQIDAERRCAGRGGHQPGPGAGG